MPGLPPNPAIPLPRQWSWRVRAAVIHAISLAQCALTAARAVSGSDQRALYWSSESSGRPAAG
jgi:hypothetical protein